MLKYTVVFLSVLFTSVVQAQPSTDIVTEHKSKSETAGNGGGAWIPPTK